MEFQKFEKYLKKDIGMYYLENKRTLPKSVKQREVCVYLQKNHYCNIWKKNRKDGLLKGLDKTKMNSKYVKYKKNEKV